MQLYLMKQSLILTTLLSLKIDHFRYIKIHTWLRGLEE